MSAACPYCARENASGALVCGACARDIVVPESLIAERDDLARKRDMVRQELREASNELDRLRRRRRYRSA